jgi:hypothetical protein
MSDIIWSTPPSSASSPSVTVGTNVADLPWNIWNRGSTTTASTAGFTYAQAMFANSIRAFPTHWKLSFDVLIALSAPIGEVCVIRTLKDNLTTVDVTPVTFGGSATPSWSSTGIQTSDSIALSIDAAHDYYICFTGNAFGGSGEIASNSGSTSEPEYTAYAGNVNNGGSKLSTAWSSSVGAGGGFAAAFPLGFNGYFVTGWNAA